MDTCNIAIYTTIYTKTMDIKNLSISELNKLLLELNNNTMSAHLQFRPQIIQQMVLIKAEIHRKQKQLD